EHGAVVFHLGRAAEEWRQRIVGRPGRLGGLGIGPRARVALIGVVDDELEAELAGRVGDAVESELDVILAGAPHPADLPRLGALAGRLPSGGVLWAVSPAGARTPGERAIAAAGAAAGLAPGDTVELTRTLRALRLTRA